MRLLTKAFILLEHKIWEELCTWLTKQYSSLLVLKGWLVETKNHPAEISASKVSSLLVCSLHTNLEYDTCLCLIKLLEIPTYIHAQSKKRGLQTCWGGSKDTQYGDLANIIGPERRVQDIQVLQWISLIVAGADNSHRKHFLWRWFSLPRATITHYGPRSQRGHPVMKSLFNDKKRIGSDGFSISVNTKQSKR